MRLNMLMTFPFECTSKLTLSEASVFESTRTGFGSLLCVRVFQRSALSQDLSTMQIPPRQYLRLPNIHGQIRSRYSALDWMALKDGRQNNTAAGTSTGQNCGGGNWCGVGLIIGGRLIQRPADGDNDGGDDGDGRRTAEEVAQTSCKAEHGRCSHIYENLVQHYRPQLPHFPPQAVKAPALMKVVLNINRS